MKDAPLILSIVCLLGVWFVEAGPAPDAKQLAARPFTVDPIGCVRRAKGKTKIVLEEQYQPGLLGLDGFSHIYVYRCRGLHDGKCWADMIGRRLQREIIKHATFGAITR